MIDVYTKTVLTVIAGCLVLLVAKEFTPGHAVAQDGQQHVVIDRVQSFAFQYAGPLAVHAQ